MSAGIRIVTLSGTLHTPSKTETLLQAITEEIGRQTGAGTTVHAVQLLDHAARLAAALGGEIAPELREQFELVRRAELLVVATPVYKGAYTGLLKLFVDFFGQDDLAGLPVLLAASGGDKQHSLVIDHELRPLFGFFRAHSLPAGVYAQGADFADGAVTPAFAETIAKAVALDLAALPAR